MLSETEASDVVVEEELTPREKAASEYERVENLVLLSEVDISRLDERMKQPLIDMSNFIKKSVPKDHKSRLPREMDGVVDLVYELLWSLEVRRGLSALCDVLFAVVDCAGYLEVELFGGKCMGLTKALQMCFGELR